MKPEKLIAIIDNSEAIALPFWVLTLERDDPSGPRVQYRQDKHLYWCLGDLRSHLECLVNRDPGTHIEVEILARKESDCEWLQLITEDNLVSVFRGDETL